MTRHDQGLPTPTCHFGRSDLSWVVVELNTKDCCCCIDLCTMTCMPFSFLSENLAKSNEGNYGNNPSKWPENWSVNLIHDQGLSTPTCHFGRWDWSWVVVEINTKKKICSGIS